MATKKTTKKTTGKTAKRKLSKAETQKLFDYLGTGKAMAWRMSNDDKYLAETRRALRSLSLAVEKALNKFPAVSVTEYFG